MSYTVKKLSSISGVSIRTLHWYDQIGLLKPSHYGDNRYRYYEKEQLLKLQQILFYRCLGFALNDIKQLLISSEFDQIKALHEHRALLQKKISKTKVLISTIDNTLAHLGGKNTMKHAELYQGFKEWAGDKGRELFYTGKYDQSNKSQDLFEELVMTSLIINDQISLWNKQDWEIHEKKAMDIFTKITQCMIEKLVPRSEQVQLLIKKHCVYASKFHSMSQDVYVALSELYSYKKEYRDQLDPINPKLYNYMSRSMKIYAYNDLD